MKKLRLTAFASGYGSTLEHLKEYETTAKPAWEIVALICDNPKARALAVAEKNNMDVVLLPRSAYKTPEDFDDAVFAAVEKQGPDAIFLMGYLRKIGPKLTRHFAGRIYNSHPSLLPKHGGKGMYGRAVHDSVILAGDLESGVTIHEVNERYDEGVVQLQKRIVIDPSWSAERLESAVKKLEKETIIQFLNQLAVTHSEDSKI